MYKRINEHEVLMHKRCSLDIKNKLTQEITILLYKPHKRKNCVFINKTERYIIQLIQYLAIINDSSRV